jgi:hypothetical protein
MVFFAEPQQLRCARERIRHHTRAGGGAGVGELFGREDEAAADGVVHLREEHVASGVERGEAHAVGVRGDAGFGIHLVAVEAEVGRGIEAGRVLAQEIQVLRVAQVLDARVDAGEVDRVG